MRAFEPFDVNVLGAQGHLWLTVRSELGSVHGVARPWPKWPDAIPNLESPATWLGDAVGRALRDGWKHGLALGRVLTDLVLRVPEVEALFHRTRGVAAARNTQLLVRLLAAPGEVAAWPWELLVDPQDSSHFLGLARDAHIVRAPRIRTFAIPKGLIEPPLNLLMVLSSPLQSGRDVETPFDLYQEKRALLAELRPLIDQGLLKVVVEDRPTMERLRRCMASERRGFHLLHYLGHAHPAGLSLESRSGRARLIGSDTFAQALQQLPDLRLAVFAGCETARAPAAVAPEIEWPGSLSTVDYVARDSCPAVIGMQVVLPFGTERVLTRFFYQALVAGHPIAEALRLARLAVAGDDDAGFPLVNWAVPCLFVGSDEPGPLVDPAAKATPPERLRRVGLRLGVRQSELRFISRLSELREIVDVLSGRESARLLLVMSRVGAGKTELVDRAIEELDPAIAYLFVGTRRLLAEEDPLAELGSLATELMTQKGFEPHPRGDLDAAQWWERLIEDLAQTRLAIVIDDGEELLGEHSKMSGLRKAIGQLTQRRTETRVVIAGNGDLSKLTAEFAPEAAPKIIRLEPLAWLDVWQWIRRNLPVLTRYDEGTLTGFYAKLPRLEQWEQLANEVADGSPEQSQLAGIVARLAVGPSSAPQAPPLFGARAGLAGRAAPKERAPTPIERPLRVAIAGFHTAGRSEQFAHAITKFAAKHHIGGRLVDANVPDAASALAELLDIKSPFDDSSGGAQIPDIITWLSQCKDAGADLILLDFGGERVDSLEALVSAVRAEGHLVIAAGGNDGKPSWPAWSPDVLAIGALDANGKPASYSKPFPQDDKPDLYAPETLAGSVLVEMVEDPNMRGTSFAAMHGTAAAIAVWAIDRSLVAQGVRSMLITTASEADRGVRQIDVAKAVTATRSGLLMKALSERPLSLRELLAATGIRPEVALPLLDKLVASGELRRGGAQADDEMYECVANTEG
jgi:hypothetical protein